MTQNLANAITMTPKNCGLKAWSHGVGKVNCLFLFTSLIQFIQDLPFANIKVPSVKTEQV